MTNFNGQDCWAISSDKYCTAAVTNVEYVLEERGLTLPPKYVTPLRCGYSLEIDLKGELNSDGVQC